MQSNKASGAAERVDFYQHLFTALEYNKKKADEPLVKALLGRFGCPPGNPDPVKWFADTQAPEDVFGWVIEQTRPFSQMLEQIYAWLAKQNATAGGNISEFEFDFANLKEKVSFNLDAFPKTYLRKWMDRLALTRTFNPAGRGRLRVDTPNYWRDDVPALSNLSYASVLQKDRFEALPEPNKHLVASYVEHIAGVLEEHYVRKTTPPEIENWQFRNYPVLYVRDERDWQRVVVLAAQSGSDGVMATSPAAKELRDLFDTGVQSGAMVPGMYIEAFLARARAADLLGKSAEIKPVYGPDLQSDDTYAFLEAYNICFPTRESTIQELIDIVDRVLLPFWQYRWRLFEVWSLIWIIQTLPGRLGLQPCLSRRSERDSGCVWRLAGGDATEPVARANLGESTLSVWFQLKTPLLPENIKLFGQDHIEPDVRVRRENHGESTDLVILELKDRHLAKGSEEKRIARMYATTGAPVVCVANYSWFGAKSLRGAVYKEDVGATHIFVVDEFGPDTVPAEVRESIRRIFDSWELPDVLIDISGSINATSVFAVLDRLADLDLKFGHWFAWSDECTEVRGRDDLVKKFGGGSTDLRTALATHRDLGSARGLIITDGDGVQQFRKLLSEGSVTELRYLCLDLAQRVDGAELDRWLARTSTLASL
jgi:hypothetical protein